MTTPGLSIIAGALFVREIVRACANAMPDAFADAVLAHMWGGANPPKPGGPLWRMAVPTTPASGE